MSKQYLTTRTIDDAHPTDIFSIAATKTQLLTASGSSSLKIFSLATTDFPLSQTIDGAHKLGCHHIAASEDGMTFASAGFGGEVKFWVFRDDAVEGQTGQWSPRGTVNEGMKAGETWAIALSSDGQYLAGTTHDGRINVWDLRAGEQPQKIREFATKGSFGMCVDLSRDGELTASGHASGAIYIFANATGRLAHALPGLLRPVRAVKFSPAGSLLAAAGDSRVIALYETRSGEQIANYSGHTSWILSLGWSESGANLLSCAWDGKVKVWSTETRTCVATLGEGEGKTTWAGVWTAPSKMRAEGFVTGGASGTISFYREAAGS